MPNHNNEAFTQAVLSWFKHHGRKDLPWQHNPTPYRVWVSEIMLQQTQVKTVIPYFQKFIKQLPSLSHLAKASDDKVMALWSGLGYYSRARNLHKAAQQLADDAPPACEPKLPSDLEQLQALPGIGRSTAGAVLTLSMNKKAAILDGNVKRVLARYFKVSGWPGKASVNKQLWQLAEGLTPELQFKDYTQAMMDLGATLCTRTKPNCSACPLVKQCLARQTDEQLNYPEKKKAAIKPVRHQYFFLLTSADGMILMEKRPPVGIWGGLWTPPNFDINNDISDNENSLLASAYLEKNFGLKPSQSLGLPQQTILQGFRHTFSHFHLQLHPIKIQFSDSEVIREDNLQWQPINYWLEQGIPAAIRKMLKQISDDHTTEG
ncbi:MAG: A/G-specific adenine glycosylase [Gammaproteobacteria bacterium]|nr:MAG: A/G-specific adenine glycosylase [Gammaproteobacteria bacterium]